jgi:DegV family protein with EDD domain
MAGIRFVADSTADLDPEYRVAHRIITVPLKVNFGEESLVDGVDIDAAAFYQRMRTTSVTPTTSQPTPAEFEAAFREAGSDGSSVVCTTLSSEMSGTYGAAQAARDAVPDIDVSVIDTRTVAVGHNILLREAVERAESRASAGEVRAFIDELIRRQRSVFTVATLEYLRKGGRIGGAAALLGSVLNIKPVLQVHNGRIEPQDRVRTYQRALERMAGELIAAVGEGGRKAHAVVGHADRPSDAQLIAARIAPHCAREPKIITIGPIVGCHAGPGTVGLSFHLPPD